MPRNIGKEKDTNRMSRNLCVKAPEAKPRRCQEVGVSASDEVPWQMKAAEARLQAQVENLITVTIAGKIGQVV